MSFLMGIKYYSVAFITFFACNLAYGQRKLSIMPAVGLTAPFSYAIEPADGDIGFSTNYSDLVPSFTLDLQYEITNKFLVFGGWHVGGNTGFNMKYGDKYKDLKEGRISSGFNTYRIQVGFNQYLFTQKWFKLKRREAILSKTTVNVNRDILYLILIKLRLVAGSSFDYIKPSTYENVWRSFSSGMKRSTVGIRSSYSIFFGLNLQFFNYHRNHFQLTFLYSQGLSEVATQEVIYSLPSGNYQAKIGSRGSFFSVQLGYPLKLVQFKTAKGI